MKKFALLSAGLLGLALLIMTGCAKLREATIKPSGRKVRIGVMGPLGLSSSAGRDGLEGIRAALKIHPLLANGDAIELFAADNENRPETAIKVFRKLVEKDRVAVVLDFSNSASVMAVEPLADQLRVPLVVIQATHPEIASKHKFVIQLCFDDIFQGTVAALFVRDELLIDRVAVIDNPENPYSVRLAQEFRRKFEKTGGQVTEIFSYDRRVADLPALMRALRKKRIQLLYMPIQAKCFIDFIRAARQIGWSPRMMGADGLLPTIRGKYHHDLEELEGLIATDFFGNRVYHTARDEKWREVYTALFHHTPTSFAAFGVESFAVLQNALNRCKNPNAPGEINLALRHTTDFPGLSGKITITESGKTHRPLIINTIKEGHIRFVVKVF